MPPVTITPEDLAAHCPDKTMPATSRECAPLYWHAVHEGEQLAPSTDVTILGLARNSMPVIEWNMQRIEHLGGMFRSWKACVYENDSDDGTDDALRAWAGRCHHVTAHCLRHDRPQLSHEKSRARTDALAEYRQACLDWAKQNTPAAPDRFVIVIDLDTWGGWSDDGLLAGLAWMHRLTDAAGMASVSTVEVALPQLPSGKLRIHYDSWAARLNHWREHDMPWFPHWFPPVGSEPVPFRSVFGGMAIYRSKAYYAGMYQGGDCEHVSFHRSIREATGLRMYLCPSMRVVMNWIQPESADGGQHGDD